MWPIWLALLAWVVGLIEGGPNAASTLSSEKLLQQQLLEQQQLQRQRDQQAVASPLQRRIASAASRPRALAERPTRAEEFNITGVLQPEYQIRATLKPNDESQ
ncbi:hypothetical protein QAD02_016086 [Eretmocerus hayati]|uniref:Uncharacterized protein n=1 Tax=Eretmocerus hayati TaxID=131215 RepID=A0ACC2PCJ2_9HYME|nr:hypothetical protein QAD02_016086 [Eretmocerus hayati]